MHWRSALPLLASSLSAVSTVSVTLPLRLEAHRVDHRVDAAVPVGALDDRRGGIVLLVEVDGNRTVGARGEVQPVGMVVDDEDPLGVQHPRAGGGHQADRAGAVDRHATALADAGIAHRLVAGGRMSLRNSTRSSSITSGITKGPLLALGT